MSRSGIEELAVKLQSMDRRGLEDVLGELDCDFKLDFTEEFLCSLSLQRLRHVVLAAAIHAHNTPHVEC